MEIRDGKLFIDGDDLADITRDLAAFAQDGESAAELRRAAREQSAYAANPVGPPPVIRHMSIGGSAWIRDDSQLGRILKGPRGQ